MKRKKLVEPLLPGLYGRMDAAELDEEVAKFDQEFIAETAKALTAKERVRDRKARQKRGRPQVGNGARRVLITLSSPLISTSRNTGVIASSIACETITSGMFNSQAIAAV